MIHLSNAMEIFKILPRNNCKDCGLPTCLAFAASAFKGDSQLDACPHLEKDNIENFKIVNAGSRTLEREESKYLKELKAEIKELDLASVAGRLGADFSDGALKIKVLGKQFCVDSQGEVTSICHLHGWITVPLLNYVLHCAGKPIKGNWVTLREFKDGSSWAGLFGQRCEKPLKRVADKYTDLFEHMIQIFSAKRTTNLFNSDIAVVMYPLPKLPMLICYWKPDGQMDSSLNIFYDSSAEHNLNVDSIYRLSAGLALMFEKIAITHG
jgi:hypothetical protein